MPKKIIVRVIIFKGKYADTAPLFAKLKNFNFCDTGIMRYMTPCFFFLVGKIVQLTLEIMPKKIIVRVIIFKGKYARALTQWYAD